MKAIISDDFNQKAVVNYVSDIAYNVLACPIYYPRLFS